MQRHQSVPWFTVWLTRQWTKNSLWQCLLKPVSWAFTAIAAVRRGLYLGGILKSIELPVPVVVVGSIAIGGSGKTPTLIALVQALQAQGFTPGVISRGYGAVANTLADEPALIVARTGVPVVCDVARVVAGKRLLAMHPQVDIILSDDGLQHYALQRDIELVVLDGARGPGTGATLPAGPFREPISSMLGNVNANLGKKPKTAARAVLWHSGPNADWLKCLGENLRAKLSTHGFNMQLGNEQFVQLEHPENTLSASDFQAKTANKIIAACAGIAHPTRFFKHLADKKITLSETIEFADHHVFSAADLAFPGAEFILMTQKDAVKCGQFNDPRIWFMQVDAQLDDAFWTWFLAQTKIAVLAKNKGTHHVARP